MATIRDGLRAIVLDGGPMTVRHAFYRAVSEGLIEKTEGEYRKTVCRLLAELRRSGDVPYNMLTDGTRWQIKPRSYGDLGSALDRMQRDYRRAVWDEQSDYVEVWCEKDAIAGILADITGAWDVPLCVMRGYPSLTFVHTIAQHIRFIGKPTFIYYFGDRDPSGMDIQRFIEKEIRAMAPGIDFNFTRAAVTAEQIAEWRLPTRPTKQSDTRARHFEGESVEVDAIAPATLKELARTSIVRHVDVEAYRRMKRVEDSERDTLSSIIAGLSGGAA